MSNEDAMDLCMINGAYEALPDDEPLDEDDDNPDDDGRFDAWA